MTAMPPRPAPPKPRGSVGNMMKAGKAGGGTPQARGKAGGPPPPANKAPPPAKKAANKAKTLGDMHSVIATASGSCAVAHQPFRIDELLE